MAHDYEDIFDTSDLDDDELQRLIEELLADNRSIDATGIGVRVRNGNVVLHGFVGTDLEQRIAERVVADRLGIGRVRNALMVDPLRRVETPEAADEQPDEEGVAETPPLGVGDRSYRDFGQTRHPNPDTEENLDDTTDSTEDSAGARELGIPWVPPLSQTPEGLSGPGVEQDAERDSY